MNFTVDNLIIKIYNLILKKGFLNTLVFGGEYVYSKVALVFLPHDLRKRIAGREQQIEHGLTIQEIRKKTLEYVESMRQQGETYGRYKYAAGQKKPVLYASIYAVLARHLYRDFNGLTQDQKNEWIEYIKSFQCEDGWFRDPEIDCELADSADWWGWRHLTFHAIMALGCLGGVADKQFTFIEQFKKNDFIESWFNKTYLSSQKNIHLIMYAVTLLQYARDFQGEVWADSAVYKIIGLLDLQQDKKTGCWSTTTKDPGSINEGVKISYHFWTFYFYDKYPINFLEAAIDSILSTQNSFGGFDNSVNSSACDDIDSIDPICRMAKLTEYKKNDIKNVLYKSLSWVLANMNEDGGFVFKRGQAFEYGHKKMYSKVDESNMFATWFRTLSLAYIGKSLPDSLSGKFDWDLEKIPGLQFWYN